MKIIINTANLRIGGALQRSVSFLQELKKFNENEYHIFCTKSLTNQLDYLSYPKNFNFYHFEVSPANLISRKKIIRKFNELELSILPDIVFSFVGPAYWVPKQTHLVGFGIPHIVYSDYYYVKKSSVKEKIEIFYKKHWTKKEADYFVVQTNDVKIRLSEKLNIDINKIFIVTNGYGSQYNNFNPKTRTNNKYKKLLLLSTYRKFKNIEIIKDVIPELQKRNFRCEFNLTINPEKYNQIFKGLEKWVKNHGPVPADKCPDLYHQCDAMFLPTLLECFSASYPEAMKMQKPILTSNLSFARSICEDAALYFNPLDASDIANKIIQLFENEELYNKLVKNGMNRLNHFDNPEERAKKYLNICKTIINND